MRERAVRFLLRHPVAEGSLLAAVAVGVGAALALVVDSRLYVVGFLLLFYGSIPLQRRLRRRRQAEWRELGIPDPSIDREVARGNPPLVNVYPATDADRRRRRIYLGLAAACAAVVVPLALLHAGAWTGVLATVALGLAGLAGVAVFARGLRAER